MSAAIPPVAVRPLGQTDAQQSGAVLRRLSYPIVPAMAIIVAFLILYEIVGISRFSAGELTDADAYMRLQRVVELADYGRWYDPSWTRTNAPYGETMHYTRPLDVLLFAGAWIGSAVADFNTALWVFGGILSPLLLLVSILVLRWGWHPFLDGHGPLALLVLLACMQPVLASAFLLGRPDHHSLIALIFVAQLACVCRMTDHPAPGRLGLVAGALGGLGIWVSVELLLAQALVVTSLAMLWIFHQGDPRQGLGAIRNYVFGLVAALVVALGLERPPSDWLVPAVARISIVHVCVAALALVTWLAIDALARRRPVAVTPSGRTGLVILGGLVPALGTLVVYPRFFAGPWADFGPLVRAWLDVNAELQPLYPTDAESTAQLLFQLGPMLVAILFMPWYAPRASVREKRLFAVVLVGLAIYLPLSLLQGRWARYPQILVLLPWAMCLLAVWGWRGGVVISGRRIPLRTLPFISLFSAHFAIGLALVAFAGPRDDGPDRPRCPWPEMAAFLDRNHAGGPGDDILFTYVFRGSEMMWRTPYDVVATPHGNEPALLDTHRIFEAPTDRGARKVLARRGIDLVLICEADVEARKHDVSADRTILAQLQDGELPNYRTAAGGSAPDRTTFHTRLREGQLPPWIEPVELPAELAPFQLFRVSHPSPGQSLDDASLIAPRRQ